MEQVIQFSQREEAKALPILLRHSPGAVLPNRIYVLNSQAVHAPLDAGIVFRELSRMGLAPTGGGAVAGERV
jgi:hypothetical protein